jgi:hypothetical protein
LRHVTRPAEPAPAIAAYSVQSFCRAHSISRALFYKLAAQGRGPQVFHVGRRVLISTEAAAEWRRQMEGTQ